MRNGSERSVSGPFLVFFAVVPRDVDLLIYCLRVRPCVRACVRVRVQAYVQYVQQCPLPTCGDNLKSREGRTNIDRVQDIVEIELRREMSLLDRVMKDLTMGLHNEKKALAMLKKCEEALTEDFDNKDIASDVDVDTRRLSGRSETLRNFRDTVTLSPERPLHPHTWVSNSDQTIKNANGVVGEAGQLGAFNPTQHAAVYTRMRMMLPAHMLSFCSFIIFEHTGAAPRVHCSSALLGV